MKQPTTTTVTLTEAYDFAQALRNLIASPLIGFPRGFSLTNFMQEETIPCEVEIEFVPLSAKQTGQEIAVYAFETMGQETYLTLQAILVLFERNDTILEHIKGRGIVIPILSKEKTSSVHFNIVVLIPLRKEQPLWEMDKYYSKSVTGKNAVMPVLKRKKPLK